MKLWLNVAEGAEYAGVCRDLIYDACRRRRADGGQAMSATLATPRLRAHPTMDDGHEHGVGRRGLPLFLTVDEAAELLRTTRRAIYAMVERRQLPGVVRLRRRVL